MIDQPRSRKLPSWWWLAPVGVIALLPWWRNHGYLRDFYDYGLVISGTGLIEQGQRPYVDFATPIQAGFFALNWLVEKAGGGTYLALTRGGAGLIVVMAGGLGIILSRRWPAWAAGLVALAVTVGSAAQHTILWHNALGVFCLALAVWGAALAPVLRRADWPWHAVVAAGLFIGGINKLNFHLVAGAAALAWALRAGLNRQAGPGRVGLTMLLWLGAGLLLPLGFELAWTGAALDVWRHNVLELAVGARAAALPQVLQAKFLLAPLHNYYGPLLLPQAGLVGIGLSLTALLGCWPAGKGWSWDRLLLPLAAVLSAAGGAALLATNQDIAHVGLAAWLVLAVAVWLGFAPSPRRGWLTAGLVLPALLLATVAWVSAWQGQRSLFGYSEAARDSYVLADHAGRAGQYLRGVFLPPEQADTLADLERWLPAADASGLRPVFYGPGTEWLERVWPAVKIRGQPLWGHWDTTYGPRENSRLLHELGTAARYQLVLTTLARDDWQADSRLILDQFYDRSLLGPVTLRWVRRDGWHMQFRDGIDFVNRIGGNVAGPTVRLEERPPAILRYEGNRFMLGVTRWEARLLLNTAAYRFGGEAVMERLPQTGQGPVRARFKVTAHGSIPEDVRWSQQLELPAGQTRLAVPFVLDALGRPLEMRVEIDEASNGLVAAGFRNLQITHAIESTGGAPVLRPGVPPDTPADAALADALFGDIPWRPQQLTVRGGRPAPQGLALAAGGEVWLHTDGMLGEMRGRVVCPDPTAGSPMVRTVWYKGGRLQIMQQAVVPAGGAFEFHLWCAEPGGWFGVLVDRGGGNASVQVQVTTAKIEP